VASVRDGEILGELEEEYPEFEEEGGLYEDEMEAEGIFGALGSALSGLLGEGEEELGASELGEGVFEGEMGEYGELGELGELGEMGELGELGELGEYGELGELGELGEVGAQFEEELAGQEAELGELEVGEAFFGRLVRRALPVLRRVAKIAAPAIGTAFGGPLGGAIGGFIGRNLEAEMQELGEYEMELQEMQLPAQEYEVHAEAEVSEAEAQAELMAAAAAGAQSEAEAQAMIGAATLAALTPAERREMRRALPHMVRASAILTRLLRRQRITRPMVRTVPSIVHHTARTLVRQRAQSGRPVTRRQAARAMTAQTRQVLTRPRVCALALQRNVRATQQLQRAAQVPIRGTRMSAPRRVGSGY
jgi:hypothetical protein